MITESADIVTYLEGVKLDPGVMLHSPRIRAKARQWQHLADVALLRLHLNLVFGRTFGEEALSPNDFLRGVISVAEFALLPRHVDARLGALSLRPRRSQAGPGPRRRTETTTNLDASPSPTP